MLNGRAKVPGRGPSGTFLVGATAPRSGKSVHSQRTPPVGRAPFPSFAAASLAAAKTGPSPAPGRPQTQRRVGPAQGTAGGPGGRPWGTTRGLSIRPPAQGAARGPRRPEGQPADFQSAHQCGVRLGPHLPMSVSAYSKPHAWTGCGGTLSAPSAPHTGFDFPSVQGTTFSRPAALGRRENVHPHPSVGATGI